jgi:NRPS condensation-like uncharacterized protein
LSQNPAPLPLTTAEEFMLWEDRPAYPWSWYMRIRLDGGLQRTAFEQAIRNTVARQPMLRALIRPRGWRSYQWEFENVPEPTIDWIDQTPTDDYPETTFLDPRSEPGLRVTVTSDGRQTHAAFLVHHCSVDGLSTMALITEALINYTNLISADGEEVPLPEIDIARLPQRNAFGLTWWKIFKMLPAQLLGLRRVQKFFTNRVIPLTPHQPSADDAPLPPGYPKIICRTMDVEQTKRFIAATKNRGVTVNDTVIWGLFTGARDWQERFAAKLEKGHLRMVVPINLRGPNDGDLPATNVASIVFIDHKRSRRNTPEKALSKIHREMGLIKRFRHGLTFLQALWLVRFTPGGIRKGARDRRKVSMIFTNLGRVLTRTPLDTDDDGRIRVGDAVVTHVDFMPPHRPFLCASLGLVWYANRLHFTLHYDPRVMSSDEGEALMTALQNRLHAFTDEQIPG